MVNKSKSEALPTLDSLVKAHMGPLTEAEVKLAKAQEHLCATYEKHHPLLVAKLTEQQKQLETLQQQYKQAQGELSDAEASLTQANTAQNKKRCTTTQAHLELLSKRVEAHEQLIDDLREQCDNIHFSQKKMEALQNASAQLSSENMQAYKKSAHDNLIYPGGDTDADSDAFEIED